MEIEHSIQYAPRAVGLMEIEHLIRYTPLAVGLMVFEYIIRHSPRRRALPWLAEGLWRLRNKSGMRLLPSG